MYMEGASESSPAVSMGDLIARIDLAQDLFDARCIDLSLKPNRKAYIQLNESCRILSNDYQTAYEYILLDETVSTRHKLAQLHGLEHAARITRRDTLNGITHQPLFEIRPEERNVDFHTIVKEEYTDADIATIEKAPADQLGPLIAQFDETLAEDLDAFTSLVDTNYAARREKRNVLVFGGIIGGLLLSELALSQRHRKRLS